MLSVSKCIFFTVATSVFQMEMKICTHCTLMTEDIISFLGFYPSECR